MAKTIPAAFATNQYNLGDVAFGESIIASDFTDVIAQQHYHWSRTGLRLGGLIFDPFVTTASVTYTFTTSGRGLHTWHATGKGLREVEDSSNKRIALTLSWFGRYADVRMNVEQSDGTAITTGVATNSTATTAWTTATVYLDPTGGGYDYFSVYVDFQKNGTGDAELFAFSIYEDIITQSDETTNGRLPTS